jgi:hypothetical protein
VKKKEQKGERGAMEVQSCVILKQSNVWPKRNWTNGQSSHSGSGRHQRGVATADEAQRPEEPRAVNSESPGFAGAS